MSTQLIAILKDSYYLLKSGKLFWLSFIIIAFFGLAFIAIGNDENGLTLLFGLIRLDFPSVSKGTDGFKLFYLGIFDQIIVGFLLTWIVPILGLISISTIFPDFMKEGSVDVALSKPISRVHLFAMKYLGGLLFVLLQVSFFAVFMYLCLGLKLGDWSGRVFIIIPVVTLVFSYLYVVNVLLGVLTRSPIVALTITLMFWFMVWGIQNAEAVVNQFKIGYQFRIENAAHQKVPEEQIERMKSQYEKLELWHKGIYYTHLAFPKIQETTDLVDRYLIPESDEFLRDMLAGDKRASSNIHQQENVIRRRVRKKYSERSLWYVIGSSLIFELIAFMLACMLFCRRDY